MIRIYERTSIAEFRLPSISADSTGGGPLSIIDTDEKSKQQVHSGIIKNIAVSCDSTDFDVIIRDRKDSTADSIDELFKYAGANLRVVRDDLHVGWVNNDSPRSERLYATVINKDLQHATGKVRIRIVSDINRRFTKR